MSGLSAPCAQILLNESHCPSGFQPTFSSNPFLLLPFVNILLESWTLPLPKPHMNLDLVPEQHRRNVSIGLAHRSAPILQVSSLFLSHHYALPQALWYDTCLHQTPGRIQYFYCTSSFAKIFNGKKWNFSPGYALRNSQESDTQCWSSNWFLEKHTHVSSMHFYKKNCVVESISLAQRGSL